MAYRIAVASSDGISIDLHFGEADHFLIYEVGGTAYGLIEDRRYMPEDHTDPASTSGHRPEGGGCMGGGGGCHGASHEARISSVSDCRCIICRKIGGDMQKALERKGISSYDVDCSVEEALEKIVSYIYKTDNHISLKDIHIRKQ
jgi:predicted Fe-Mo cluster-binding NifX family protein